MTRQPLARRALLVAAAGAVLTTAACGAQATATDRAALADIAAVAGPTMGVSNDDVTGGSCWLPHAHRVDHPDVPDSTFRVICRVEFLEDQVDRWRDTTCIGDFDETPMLTHCYRWAPYTGEPAFEDHAAIDWNISGK